MSNPFYYRKRLTMFLTLVVLLAVVGCAPKNLTTEDKVIYSVVKTLDTAKTFRTLGLQTAGKLHTDGVIDDKMAREIITVANDLQASINATALLLETYKKTNSEEDKKLLDEKVAIYMELYGKFVELIMPYVMERIGD